MFITIDVTKLHKQLKELYMGAYSFPNITNEYKKGSNSKITIVCPIHGKSKLSVKNMIGQHVTCKKCSSLRYSISVEYDYEFAFWMLLRFSNFIKNKPGIVKRTHKTNFNSRENTMLLYSLFENSDDYKSCHQSYQELSKIVDNVGIELDTIKPQDDSVSDLHKLLDKQLESLDISKRIINALSCKIFYSDSDPRDIYFLGDLVQKSESELLKLGGIGPGSINELEAFLHKYDLHLGMDVKGWKTHKIYKF